MKQRTISAIILMIILIGCFAISSKVFGFLMLIVSLIGFNEFYNVKFNKKNKFIKYIGMFCLGLIIINSLYQFIDVGSLMILSLIGLSVPVVFINDKDVYNIEDVFFIVGIIYLLGFGFGNIAYLRDIDIYKCIFIFIIAFITDTYAYIGGRLIGRHKLTSISPKKTIEGSIVGSFVSVVVGTIYYMTTIGGISLTEVIIMTLMLSVISQIGDLMFSSIKRFYDTKDFSNLIPGHGGILDRFDSVIYVSLGLSLLLNIM